MSEDEHLTIARAKAIIETIGGIENAMAATSRSRSRVHAWTYERSAGGSGGIIPARCQLELVAYARAHGLPLEPAHFFPPFPSAEAAE